MIRSRMIAATSGDVAATGGIAARLRDLQIGCHVPGLVEESISYFHRHLLDKCADAELLLADDLDANDVFLRVEIEHDKALLGAERLRAHNC